LDIDFGDTKSPIGYGYVLTLDKDALSLKYVRKLFLCHDLLCKHKFIPFVQCILTIKLLYLKFFSKNVNEIDIWEWETNILET